MNFGKALGHIYNCRPNSSIESYCLSKDIADFVGKLIKCQNDEIIINSCNLLNTRYATLHGNPLNHLTQELAKLRMSIIQKYLNNQPSIIHNSQPSEYKFAFVVRNLNSLDDPEVQLTLGIVNASQFASLRVYLLGSISKEVYEILIHHSSYPVEIIPLSKKFGKYQEELCEKSIHKIYHIAKYLLSDHDGYFVFMTDVAAKVRCTSILAALLKANAILCYHSPMSSGSVDAKWLLFDNTSRNASSLIQPELSESPYLIKNLNLHYLLPESLSQSNFPYKEEICQVIAGKKYFFHLANYWKLTCDELTIIDDILSLANDIYVLISPFPPHYRLGDQEKIHEKIKQIISEKNQKRLIVFAKSLGHLGIDYLIENSIGALSTFQYPCISSMPIVIKHNKHFWGGLSFTIRGALCMQYKMTVKQSKLIHLTQTHPAYISSVKEYLRICK